MSRYITEYLERLDIAKFDAIVPNRRRLIEAGSAELPASEYNVNRVAKALHPRVQHLVISEIHDHVENAKSFVFKAAPNTETKALAYFRAGQYLSIKLNIGESVLTRAYTISSAPAEALAGSYSITIKRTDDGFASNFMFDNWRAGTVIEASAPLGEFGYEPLRDKKHIVGLAGGSGITPFYSIARAIADGTEDVSLTLLYGSRTQDEILLRDELNAIADSCDKVKIVHVLSDDPAARGCEHGFLTAELIEDYVPAGDYSVFICGPSVMYQFLETELEKLGLPRRLVRYEVFGDHKSPEKDPAYPRTAVGKTYKLKVEILDKKMVVPAKSGESLLVAMERAGIAAPSLCRSGECGFCRSRLMSGDFYTPTDMDYRRQADVEYGYIHPCCTFPTGDMHIRVCVDKGEIERKTMKQRVNTMRLSMTVFMSVIMGIAATLLSRLGAPPQAAVPPLMIAMGTNILMSLVVGFIIWLTIPAGKWGRALIARAKAGPGSFKANALNSLPISMVNGIIISAVVSFVNIRGSHAQIPADFAPPLMVMWSSSWIKMLPVMLVLAFITAMLISPLIAKWVKLPGKPPKRRK